MLRIGRRNPGDPRQFGLNGRIDDVAIWQRSLTDNDIQALWNNGFGRPEIATATSGQQAAAVSTVTTLSELATPFLDEFQQPSGKPEFTESTIGAENSFPANASLQLSPFAQSASRPSYTPSTIRREYRTSVDFATFQPSKLSTLTNASRFDSAIEELLTSPAQESEAHESVDHALDEFDEDKLVLKHVW